jgi:hypothetical protein
MPTLKNAPGNLVSNTVNLLIPNGKTPSVQYLVIAGGGAGGGNGLTNAGPAYGGGAGGMLCGYTTVSSGSSITVTVGAGGTGAANAAGTSGANSVFGSQTATGGGYGASNAAATTYGSGGSGGSYYVSSWQDSGGTAGQGFSGGVSIYSSSMSGGGGAGSQGQLIIEPSNWGTGVGGYGALTNIFLVPAVYASGGNSGAANSTNAYAPTTMNPRPGGGGKGSPAQGSGPAFNGAPATQNTGGGGGAPGGLYGNVGGFPGTQSGGNGGSGFVAIAYPATYDAAATVTGTYTTFITNGNRVYVWTANGSITF